MSNTIKSHVERASLWTKELAKVVDAKPGKAQQFVEHPIRARVMQEHRQHIKRASAEVSGQLEKPAQILKTLWNCCTNINVKI
jgi:hypothetical protein